jgi:hypothetical protein
MNHYYHSYIDLKTAMSSLFALYQNNHCALHSSAASVRPHGTEGPSWPLLAVRPGTNIGLVIYAQKLAMKFASSIHGRTCSIKYHDPSTVVLSNAQKRIDDLTVGMYNLKKQQSGYSVQSAYHLIGLLCVFGF